MQTNSKLIFIQTNVYSAHSRNPKQKASLRWLFCCKELMEMENCTSNEITVEKKPNEMTVTNEMKNA